MERYLRNHTAISKAEQKRLAASRVLVAGCGGLGGYVIELLGRIGVGHITALDRDVFEPSNLNRQLLSAASSLGTAKAQTAALRMADVNPEIEVVPLTEELTAENALRFVRGQDLVVDALDSRSARLLLLHAAQETNVPLVHGAIAGWRGRVCVVFPEDKALAALLDAAQTEGGSPDGVLGFTSAYTASLQAAEAVKLLIGRGPLKRGILLDFDLLSGAYEEIPLNNG